MANFLRSASAVAVARRRPRRARNDFVTFWADCNRVHWHACYLPGLSSIPIATSSQRIELGPRQVTAAQARARARAAGRSRPRRARNDFVTFRADCNRVHWHACYLPSLSSIPIATSSQRIELGPRQVTAAQARARARAAGRSFFQNGLAPFDVHIHGAGLVWVLQGLIPCLGLDGRGEMEAWGGGLGGCSARLGAHAAYLVWRICLGFCIWRISRTPADCRNVTSSPPRGLG